MIREAQAKDLPKIRDIEAATGEYFRPLGMDAIADDAPLSLEALAVYQQAGRAWVATGSGDEVVAYLLVNEVGPYAHIEQVSVHPLHARKALGRKLIDAAGSWAAARGLQGMTLTTFEDVPWNAPYYSRLGFRPVPEPEWPEGIRRIVRAENAHGLGAWPRVVMKMDVPGK